MKRTLIKDLKPEMIGSQVELKGWARTRRGNKHVQFVQLNDGSNVGGIQVVFDMSKFTDEQLKPITTGASLRVVGNLVESMGKGQSMEVQAESLELYGTCDPESYPLQKKGHTLEFLREKGLATAQKKANRVAAEGLCKTLVADDAKNAVVVEVNSETDFVAKNEKFQQYVADVAAQALTTTAADIDAFLAEAWALDTTKTVKEALAAQIAVIGENMNIRRFAQMKEENGFVASYTHMGGKIGVLVDVETDVVNDAVKEMAKNVAMQVAALKPLYTSDSEVSAEYIEHEKEILMAQIQNDPKESQKPEKVIQGMITGRIKKELKEICLLDQIYVKAEDGKQSVGNYVAQVAKENGAKITIKGFVRYETGDGIEKKEENFAEEVAKQMGK
mgnify:CR=1 FL=1